MGSLMEARRRILLSSPHSVTIQNADIASFSTDMRSPLRALTLGIDPVQDLHGYDAPWPAGGGANVLDPNIQFPSDTSLFGLTLSTTDGYHYAYAGTATSSGNIKTNTIALADAVILPAGTYIASSGRLALYSASTDAWLKNQYSNSAFTMEEPFYVKSIYWEIVSGREYNSSGFIALAKGSIAPTAWTPYSNLCPISGWSAANVYDDPKHGGTVWWNQQFPAASEWKAHSAQSSVSVSDGVITATLISGTPSVYSPAITITGGTTVTTIAKHKYYMACKFNSAADGFPYLRNTAAFPVAAVFGSQTTRAGEWGSYENIISATATGGPALYLGNAGNISQIQIGDSFSIKDLMCIDLTAMFGAGNEPSTVEEFKALFPNDYYAYNAGEETLVSAVNGDPYRAVTIDLDGTRYGGTLDVLSGVLTVDKAEVDLGTLNWGNWNSVNGWIAEISPAIKQMASNIDPMNAIASDLKVVSKVESLAIVSAGTNEDTISAAWTGAYVYGTNANRKPTGQLVYELATPITIPLTPTQISTLAGQNVVWGDSGKIELLKYWTH